MEAMRQSWTDGHLDDFRGETRQRFDEVDRRFDEVDKRFEAVDERFDEVDERFKAVDERFEEMDKRFDKLEIDVKELGKELHLRFDALQRAMLQFSGTVVLALVALMATQL